TEFLAASLLGGLVVSSTTEANPEITTQRITWPQSWHLIVLVPEYRLASPQARAVLPETVTMKNAIHNIQRSALLVAAVVNEDEEALKKALDDRLHESYRTALVPHLQPLKTYLSGQPILGCVLSGAGTGMIVFVNKRREQEVRQYL